MKKLTSILTAVLLTLSLAGFSQKTPSISGILKDDNTKPLSGVSVSLYRAKDTVLLKGAITDKAGQYVFEGVKEGAYFIGTFVVGHKKIMKPVEVAAGQDVQLNLVLEPEVRGLKEVVVTAKKPLFEQKPDKLVVNVDASPTNAGSTALDILEKSPGVSVDKDGNISLKGKAGVQVYIDGKPAYLSGADLANYLKNMQGAQLEQIEIMTNPPAKYDAAGNSGIINIRTKKTKQFGYNISVTAGVTQGVYPRNNQSVNFNFRKNKINLFGNLNRSERNSFNQMSIQRRFMEPNTKQVVSNFEQISLMRNWNSSNSAKLGLDYNFTKKTSVGMVLNGFYNPGVFRNASDIDIFDASHELQSKTMASSIARNTWKNASANVNFRHQFDSTGKELTADVDYIQYNSSNKQRVENAYFDANGNPVLTPDVLLGNLPQNIKIYSAKADYVHPLKKGAKIEAGLKTSFVRTDNDATYDSLINGNLVRDYGRSNHFVYDENINAAYVSYTRPISKKLSGQFGLRLENTEANGNQKTTGETFKLSYTQLFPTLFLQYTASEKNSWSVNYGRRIRRPDYESLNPFVEFLDRYTYEQGNPYLRPQFSHNVELTHTYKGFLNTTLNYTNTNNIIQQVLEQNTEKNETYVKQANIAKQQQIGLAVSAFKQIKNFSGNIYANVYYNQFKGIVSNAPVDFGLTTVMFNGSVSYKFKKGWNTEVSGFYRTPGMEGVFRIESLGMLNLGASKSLFNNKATIRLNVRDVLWTQRAKGTIRFGDIDTKFQQHSDTRTANISFTYRFTKGKVNGGRQKKGGAGDEESRVKAGDN